MNGQTKPKENDDPLHRIPVERWSEIENAFKQDWPRGIPAYKLLETQRTWLHKGIDCTFKVYCPFGDTKSGLVAINGDFNTYMVVVQCPGDDTSKLEKALRTTKLIDWATAITFPYSPKHIQDCIQKVIDKDFAIPSHCFYLKKSTPKFENISLPSDIKFGLLTFDHIELVDRLWPHRYPGSEVYFQKLIANHSGYGIFKEGTKDPIAWVFVNESGNLGHMFTLKEHRRRRYAELLLKLVCNKLLDEGKDISMFCVRDNISAYNLYTKVGFTNYDVGTAWVWSKPRSKI